MKFNDFRKKMQKTIFSTEEASRIALETSPKTLNLELHQWVKKKELIRLKRGLYAFSERLKDKMEICFALYVPAYVSLEYALHYYGLIPDVPFSLTLVTPKPTRQFQTPMGTFDYRHIKNTLFFGYNPDHLMGDKEKVIVDYCYLNSHRLIPDPAFWKEARFQNLEGVDFKKAGELARKTGVKKVERLVQGLKIYGETSKNY